MSYIRISGLCSLAGMAACCIRTNDFVDILKIYFFYPGRIYNELQVLL
jgi:hypothetical protein